MSDHLTSSDRLDDRLYNFIGDYGAHVVFYGLWLFWTVVAVLISPTPASMLEWAEILFASLIMTLIILIPVAFIIGLVANALFYVYWTIRDVIDEIRYRQGS